MNGFIVAGKAFCVFEELKRFAEQNKGKTVNQVMRLRRIEEAEAKQLGISVDQLRNIIKK